MYKGLVISDLDGTLFHEENQKELNDGILSMIRFLKERQVLFCIASGRSYRSLSRLFEPVKNEIVFLCENGALIYYQDKLVDVIDMDRRECSELIRMVSSRNDCYLRINTPAGSYLLTDDPAVAKRLLETDGITAKTVRTLDDIPGRITQITAFSTEAHIYPAAEALLPVWKDRLGAAVTGDYWLDFTAAGKGNGLKKVCHMFRIPLEHTCAFGDFYNDEPMLDIAGTAFIMDGAPEPLLRKYPNHCLDVTETVLKEFQKRL